MVKTADNVGQMADASRIPAALKRNGLWRSHLCALIFSLAMVVVAWGGLLVWSLFYGHNTYTNTLGILLFLGAAILLVVLFYRIQTHFLRPLTQIRHWVTQMIQGQHGARLSLDNTKEFSELTKDINLLGNTLQTLSEDMQSQVQQQTHHIQQKTRSLEIIYDVAASINVSRDLEDLLTRFLHTLKDVVHARAAVVRLVTDDDQMHLVSSIGFDEDLMEREQLIPSQACLCGNAYEEGRVLFQRDLTKCDKIVGRAFFGKEDIGMVVVPLQYRDRTLGVYNLFVYREDFADTADVKDLLTSIGRHLGMAIDKARSDDEANRLSIMEERTRIAHELHDSLAQTLASLRFQVRVLDETMRQGNEPGIWHELEKIEDNLDEAYGELRELITHFRAPVDKRGLVPAVEHLVARFRDQTGIHIFLQKEWHLLQLPASTEVQVLRIIQEAMNNIRKHSQANFVRIMLRSNAQGDCQILIEDDGIGIKSSQPDQKVDHYGLHIMEDRAKRINADLKIESETGEGTRVFLNFHHPSTQTLTSNAIEVAPPLQVKS
jgi:two-component system nitrate/nitrite sensor histidine kinase NarX